MIAEGSQRSWGLGKNLVGRQLDFRGHIQVLCTDAEGKPWAPGSPCFPEASLMTLSGSWKECRGQGSPDTLDSTSLWGAHAHKTFVTPTRNRHEGDAGTPASVHESGGCPVLVRRQPQGAIPVRGQRVGLCVSR